VLNEIECWTQDFDKSPVFWLNGLAGTGKSAIARTIAERAFANGNLGASFFCSRGVKGRSDLRRIFPTLAFQLALQYPEFGSSLILLLQSNPNIVHESLHDQMQQLLVKPLLSANISTVIVIDALDECRDEDQGSAILRVLGQTIPKLPRAKFFITSRPEPHIMAGFRDSLLAKSTDVFILHNIEPDTVVDDVRHFLKHKLSELAHQHRINGWPAGEDLDALCRRAAGSFVYAVVAVRFLDHWIKDPQERLREILKSPESTAHEGKAKLEGYTSLDSLYTSIFQAVFIDNDDDDDGTVRSILSVMVLATTPLSPSAIVTLTGSSRNEVQRILELIQSLLVPSVHHNYPVPPFHTSFPVFITDPTRCVNPRFYISPDYHTKLALCCLKLISKLPEGVYPAPGDARIEDSGVRDALEYARKSWHTHLLATKDRVVDTVDVLHSFLESAIAQQDRLRSKGDSCGDPQRSTKHVGLFRFAIPVPPCLIPY
jgi:hypothetical protein